jgi:carboxymethylenebutenolidase
VIDGGFMAVEKVRIQRGTTTIGGILAVPQRQGTYPGIIMIPTIKALDEFAVGVVARLASENFVALGVDIFDHPGIPEDPFKRPGSQPDEQVLGDLDAALLMLRNHPMVGDEAIFAWGYCLGGRFALLWPTYQSELAGAASFHGFPTNDTTNPNTPTQPLDRVPYLHVPIVACFGEADRLVPMKDVAEYREKLQSSPKIFEIHTYAGADHGWTNAKAPAYRKDAAEDCWRRSITFLREHAIGRAKLASAG